MESYTDLLKAEFAHRCEKNSNYSLRAFARDLTLDPGHLSRIIARKQRMSTTLGEIVAHKLYGNRKRSKNYFCALLEKEWASRNSSREIANKKLQKLGLRRNSITQLKRDQLRFVASWFHVAILEYLSLPKKQTHKKIARSLGVTEMECRIAIERMKKLGVLIEKGGRLSRNAERLHTTSGIPSRYIKEHHRQMIPKGIEALDSQSVKERWIASRTLSISKKKVSKFFDLFEEFFDSVYELSREDDDHDAVYQLNLQFFNLERKRSNASN